MSSVGNVVDDTSSGPYTPAAASTGDTSPCADCFGCGEPCAGCVAAAGDPRPEEFAVGDPCAGALVMGTRRCSCGRVYGSYHAGRHLCFVMEAPGRRRQVERCVRCGVQLHAGSTEDCTPAGAAVVRATPVAKATAA